MWCIDGLAPDDIACARSDTVSMLAANSRQDEQSVAFVIFSHGSFVRHCH